MTRIGIDIAGIQTPGSYRRGIGRYGLNLVRALLDRDPINEYILYCREDYPAEETLRASNASTVPLDVAGASRRAHPLAERTRTNRDRLDVLLILSPLDPTFAPLPSKPLNGLRMASVVHDLIPLLFPDRYFADPESSARYHDGLHVLQQYDALLANSEATRIDVQEAFGLPEGRIVTIGGASDDQYFVPDQGDGTPDRSARTLRALGLVQPFILNVGGTDDRKNMLGLIDAFSRLPRPLRQSYQLAITCRLSDRESRRLRRHAKSREIGGQVVLTNEVPDETLRILYQRCASFVFPSIYEGFGLPILEAMHCGAPVIAGDNSSQIEVVGDAGLLVDPADPDDIAEKIRCILESPERAQQMRRRSIAQAANFSWSRTADRAIEVLNRLGALAGRSRALSLRRPAARPRIALFSPFPPKRSGISDYASRLVAELQQTYDIDLFHDAGYVPSLGDASLRVRSHDYRLFEAHADVHDYRAVFYQMGNSEFHGYIYEAMRRHPGLVTNHDLALVDFHWWYANVRYRNPGLLRDELRYDAGDRPIEIPDSLDAWYDEPGGLPGACQRRELWIARRVLEAAERVVVHSPWCVEKVRQQYPEYHEKMRVIPYGATTIESTEERRATLRRHYNLSAEALVLVSLGILSESKMNIETVDAFASLAAEDPSATLLFVGPEFDQRATRRRVAALGLDDRVRFFGHRPADELPDFAAVADIGVALRRPPTNGETSAALMDLLRTGAPTIVNDSGSFADYPTTVVRRLTWESEGVAGLARAMRELAGDREGRVALGRRAREYVAREHAWSRTASLYVELIETLAARRSQGRSVPSARGEVGRTNIRQSA